MEWWEVELRAKLNQELDDGLYLIGSPPDHIAYTGKQGKIEFDIALQKMIRMINQEDNGENKTSD